MRILSTIIFIIMSLVNLNAQIEKVEDLFSDYRAGESPGASVLVAMNGKIVFVKTYGYANLEEKIFVETKTNFRLASVTKQFKYSNTGYALLLLMVEKISRISFAKFLEENIFKPLQMNNTVAHEEGISVVNNRAYGYVRTDTEWMRKDQSITSAVLGDGGIYSNVKDLFKWDQSLYTNGILSDDLRLISMTRAILKSGEKIDYGYGWHLKSYKGNEIVYHGGSTQGFRNVIYRVPSKKFTVIILTNRNEGEPEKIAERIFDLYFKY